MRPAWPCEPTRTRTYRVPRRSYEPRTGSAGRPLYGSPSRPPFLADLVVLRGDPLTDIGFLARPENIGYVVQDGTVVTDNGL